MVGHNTACWATIQATTRLREATTRSAAPARGLAGGLCRDTQICIVTEARGWPLGGCVTIQSLYRDRRAVWLARVSRYNRLYCDRRKAWPLGVSRYNAATWPGLCCDTDEEPATRRAATTRQGTPATRPGGGHDTVSCAPRYSPARATIRRRARGLGGVGLQLGFRVCTWCT